MRVGKDVYISEQAVFKRPHLVKLGSRVAIDSFVYCTTALVTGDFIHISPHVSIVGGENGLLLMGNFCTIAAGCRIICASDLFDGSGLVTAPGIPEEYLNAKIFSPVIMGDYSSLASNVVVCPGVTIGEGAVVGANSFVDKNIPAWEIWVGNPARFLKTRPRDTMKEYGEKLRNEIQP